MTSAVAEKLTPQGGQRHPKRRCNLARAAAAKRSHIYLGIAPVCGWVPSVSDGSSGDQQAVNLEGCVGRRSGNWWEVWNAWRVPGARLEHR